MHYSKRMLGVFIFLLLVLLYVSFENHWRQKPLTVEEIIAHGKQFSEKKLYDLAVLEFDKAIAKDSRSAYAYAMRGHCYLLKQEYATAVKDFTLAIELSPKYEDAISRRAYANAALQNFREALADYDQVVKLNPKNDKAFFEKGLLLGRYLRDYDLAIENLNKAIEINPRDDKYYYVRARTYYEIPNYEKTIADCNKVLEIKKDEYNAVLMRAMCFFNIKEYDKALADVDILKTAKVPIPAEFEESIHDAIKKTDDIKTDLSNLPVQTVVSSTALNMDTTQANLGLNKETKENKIQTAQGKTGKVKLTLKSHQTVEGEVVEQSKDYIKVKVEGIGLTFYNDAIDKVE